MTVRTALASAAAALVTLLASGATAQAQGALVGGSVGAAVADGRTSPVYSGSVTYRFNSVLGIGVELSHLRKLTSDFPYIYCCRNDDRNGRATVFTTNVRLEIPTASERIVPFVVGGGGVASVTESYSVVYAQVLDQTGLGSSLAALGLDALPILPGPSRVDTTSTGMALTLGGGASFLVTEHFAVDADLRVLRITGNPSRNIGRFGAGVSYRF